MGEKVYNEQPSPVSERSVAPSSRSMHPDSDRARIPSTSVLMAAAGLCAEGAGLARMYGERGGDGGEGGEGGGGDWGSGGDVGGCAGGGVVEGGGGDGVPTTA